MSGESERQKAHYEAIHHEYEAHYYDEASMQYRWRYIYGPLFDGLDLNGKRVADLASGSGHNSLALLQRFPEAKIAGFDISDKACEGYRELTGLPAFQIDLTKGVAPDYRVDAAMIIGGLHHCVADLEGTFRTIAGMLEPGGMLLMCEPNQRYLLEGARKLWYRLDGYFDEHTEEALDHEAIAELASPWFTPQDCQHLGGPAYFLIYNSLVLRVPLGSKNAIAPALFKIEEAFNRLPGRRVYPYFVARWKRNG
jgi:ubiquinone/menaquinone biosynthesis C-methylase UbiE